MLVAAGALSTPLAAQSASLGFAATAGGGYQVEALDVGYMHDMHAGFLRSATLGLRVGSFIDEGAIVGGARGIVGALWFATRTGLVHLADVGNETNPQSFGWDVTFEASGYASSAPPDSLSSPWAAISILPGVRLGEGPGAHYSFVAGPTVFLGHKTDVRAFIGLRFEIPLAKQKPHP